jgi:hypothetical protein
MQGVCKGDFFSKISKSKTSQKLKVARSVLEV